MDSLRGILHYYESFFFPSESLKLLIVYMCAFARNGTFIIDPLVKVYDIRTMRPLAPISFPSGPCFLRMHPKLSTTVFIVSHSGQFHVLDVVNTSDIRFYQVRCKLIIYKM